MTKKLTFTSILAQILLLLFVVAWIAPTFGLFISSLRDKDVLAISGWWTSFITTEVNEIYRTKGMEAQFEKGGYFYIEDNLFGNKKPKEISSFGITSKNINEYSVGLGRSRFGADRDFAFRGFRVKIVVRCYCQNRGPRQIVVLFHTGNLYDRCGAII